MAFVVAPPNPDSEIPGLGPYLNTIDNDKPASQVAALSSTQPNANFQVSWSGTDVGAGVKDYSVYVLEDNGPFKVWLANTPETSGTFFGENGKTYAFYSVARDQTGNAEAAPGSSDASTTVHVMASAPASEFRLLEPNGGEVYKAGKKITVRWTAPNVSPKQKLKLKWSKNGGAKWKFLKTVKNKGITKWKPKRSQATDRARLMICVPKIKKRPAICDASDGNFTITR